MREEVRVSQSKREEGRACLRKEVSVPVQSEEVRMCIREEVRVSQSKGKKSECMSLLKEAKVSLVRRCQKEEVRAYHVRRKNSKRISLEGRGQTY